MSLRDQSVAQERAARAKLAPRGRVAAAQRRRPSAVAALAVEGLWVEADDGVTRLPVKWPLAAESALVLFDAMRRRGLAVVYVHHSALEPLGLPVELEVPKPGERRPAHPWLAGELEGVRPSRRALSPSIEWPATNGTVPELLLGAYQDGAGDPFAGAADGRELLEATLAYRDALDGWLFRHSAMSTGWKLLHELPERKRQTNLHDNRHPAEIDGQAEIPFGSWAAPAELDAGLPFVLGWDINGQRLAACSRLSVGTGGLEPSRAPFDGKTPGYHLIREVDWPFGERIPPIFEPGWHTTPRVAMADFLGIRYTLERSWLWREHTAYFDPWYLRLKRARETLLERDDHAGELALRALKQTYLQPLGRLRSARTRERNPSYWRPSWYDAIIGHELAKQYLRLHELAALQAPVLAVYFDAIVIESNRPAPDTHATLGVLEVSEQLGKFKALGILPTGSAREHLYGPPAGAAVAAGAPPAPNVARLVQALKASPLEVEGGKP